MQVAGADVGNGVGTTHPKHITLHLESVHDHIQSSRVRVSCTLPIDCSTSNWVHEVGKCDGKFDGVELGEEMVGFVVGDVVGMVEVGESDGVTEGKLVGSEDAGALEGEAVGSAMVGDSVGVAVGTCDGW